MFLSQEEIRELTGYKVYKCQIKWLANNGIKFLIGYDGKPRVLISHIENIMGSLVNNTKKTKPNEKALLERMGIT